jgi:hypothetical protein
VGKWLFEVFLVIVVRMEILAHLKRLVGCSERSGISTFVHKIFVIFFNQNILLDSCHMLKDILLKNNIKSRNIQSSTHF